eukprot:CAMPEP_0171109740 /NCGR_PEP_ID=MMETSP0766_2-20121228/70952_1 /TAXON_ID=439317 /ORGANISM="Gambierdiscus australes, Strain CAWD 149" /LENGTH=141 /DNA_ID=CAMNT_0011571517 /DNA_START=518 /DNA_END=943 /DNA_ORIENTATION=+
MFPAVLPPYPSPGQVLDLVKIIHAWAEEEEASLDRGNDGAGNVKAMVVDPHKILLQTHQLIHGIQHQDIGIQHQHAVILCQCQPPVLDSLLCHLKLHTCSLDVQEVLAGSAALHLIRVDRRGAPQDPGEACQHEEIRVSIW